MKSLFCKVCSLGLPRFFPLFSAHSHPSFYSFRYGSSSNAVAFCCGGCDYGPFNFACSFWWITRLTAQCPVHDGEVCSLVLTRFPPLISAHSHPYFYSFRYGWLLNADLLLRWLCLWTVQLCVLGLIENPASSALSGSRWWGCSAADGGGLSFCSMRWRPEGECAEECIGGDVVWWPVHSGGLFVGWFAMDWFFAAVDTGGRPFVIFCCVRLIPA